MHEQSLTGRQLGIYTVERVIGEGAGGAVYAARSTQDGPAGGAGTVVAIKVFHPELTADARIFQRFVREAELGIRIRHPHIVPTYEFGSEEVDGTTLHFMVMELVQGDTLRDTLAELRVLPEDLIHQVTDQILDALAAVHAEGMIHRDVKPENVILTTDQQVRLMDLGIARLQQEGRDLTRADEFVGSLAYAAPEQFTDQDHVDPRADLYAVGVLLYEMATGRNPYDEADLAGLLRQKLEDRVRRPKILNRDLSPFLDDVILKCLHIDPEARFAGCEELRNVLREGEEGSWWAERVRGEAFPAATRALRTLRPTREAPLIARAEELSLLHAAYDRAAGGSGVAVLVSGAAGSGKSRLVHDFLEELVAPDGPFILTGECATDMDASHHAFLQAAVSFFGGGEGWEERLRALLPDAGPLTPRLLALRTGEPGPPEDDDLATTYASMLLGLAKERPVVMAIEDLHRAEPEAVTFFDRLASRTAGGRVLLVTTQRPEEVDEGSDLHALATRLAGEGKGRTIPVSAFDREETDQLVLALVGSPQTVRTLSWPLYRASDGNPRFLLETVAQLKQTGALEEGPDGWTPTRPIREIALPATVRELQEARLAGLEEESAETLRAAAVLGYAFDASLLTILTGQKRIRLLKRLAVLERKHRLLVGAGRNTFRFGSRALHRVVYESIPEEPRRGLHAACADAIREGEAPIEGARAYAHVRHSLQAGRHPEDDGVLASAIAHVGARFHAAEALRFFERLLEALPAAAVARRVDVRLRAAACHARQAHLEARDDALARARAEAEALADAGLLARVQAALAAASQGAGRYDEAEAEAKRGAKLAEEAGDAGSKATCLHRLGEIAFRRGAFAESALHWREAREIRRRLGDRRGEAQVLTRLGAVLPEIGEGDRALQARRSALDLQRETGDRRGESEALNGLGDGWVDAGKYADALDCYAEAARIAREGGDLPEEAAALANQARVMTIEGRIDAAKATFERALDIYRQLRDPSGEARVLDGLGAAIAAFGDRDEALTCLQGARDAVERTGERALLSRTLHHQGAVRHEAGEREEAWRLYDRALALAHPRRRPDILADMGRAAEEEGDHARAADLLGESVDQAEGTSALLLSLCRLARVHHAAGRTEEAMHCALRAEQLIDAGEVVAPQHGPEIYYSLGTVLAGEQRARAYLETAHELLGARTQFIRSIVYRDHYLTSQWPNREILTEVRRLAEA
ncbi:MAG: serine/threonine-protein kinase [Planctomycetota bacterium]|jgi:tetratricopeptide (TPR) repeat protein